MNKYTRGESEVYEGYYFLNAEAISENRVRVAAGICLSAAMRDGLSASHRKTAR